MLHSVSFLGYKKQFLSTIKQQGKQVYKSKKFHTRSRRSIKTISKNKKNLFSNKFFSSNFYTIFASKTNFRRVKSNKKLGKLKGVKNRKLSKDLSFIRIKRLSYFLVNHNKKFYSFYIMKYNLPYLSTALKKLLKSSSISWNVLINDRNSLGSQDVSNIINRKLRKLRNQRKLFNPLKMVVSQINFNYVLEQFKFNASPASERILYYSFLLRNLSFDAKKFKSYLLLKSVFNFNNNSSINLIGNNFDKLKSTNKKNIKIFNLLNCSSFTTSLRTNLNWVNGLSSYKNFLFNGLSAKPGAKKLYYPSLPEKPIYNVLGYKIDGFGRLGFSSKSSRKSKTTYLRGKTTSSSLDTLIDFHQSFSMIRNGVYGLKISKYYKKSFK